MNRSLLIAIAGIAASVGGYLSFGTDYWWSFFVVGAVAAAIFRYEFFSGGAQQSRGEPRHGGESSKGVKDD